MINVPLDLIFLIDTTGSMGSFIGLAKKFMKGCLLKIKDSGADVSVSVIDYRDHPPEEMSYPAKIQLDRENNIDKVEKVVSKISLGNGGDPAESGLDAINLIDQLNWGDSESIRIAFFIGDAPILGTHQAHGCFNSNSKYNLEKNCRCGLTIFDALRIVEKRGINLHGFALTGGEVDLSFSNFCEKVYTTNPTSVFQKILEESKSEVDLYKWSIECLLPELTKDPYIKISDLSKVMNVSSIKINRGIEILNIFGLTKTFNKGDLK